MRAALEVTRTLVDTWTVRIADLDLRTVRREVRRRVTAHDDDRPIVLTGHQPEFIHAGVWAKHVVVSRLAEAVGGVAVNLTVDTDVAKATALSLPVLTGGQLSEQAIQFADVPPDVSYEDIPRLDDLRVSHLADSARQALGRRFERSMLGPYFEYLAEAQSARDFVDQATIARSGVERTFAVNMLERRVSQSWFCPLLAEILGQAPRVFECYNAALAEYRRAQGIRGSRRPIPDLLREGDRVELPLWVKPVRGGRSRLFVEQRGDALCLYADRRSVGSLALERLKTWDRAVEVLGELEDVVLRPRALMLTLWARMLLTDLFVHGIGGAKYDRITDLLMTRCFGVRPPPMACVSATLRLDLPRHDASPQSLAELVNRRRDLTWNPQRHLGAGEDIAELVEARARAVERSQSLRADDGRHRAQRREVFHQIRSISRRMLGRRADAQRDLDESIARTDEALRQNAVADRRDYFFALHDRSALERLCEALPAVGDFRV